MRRRELLNTLVIPMLAGGCTPPLGQAQQAEVPPSGAVTVGAAFPPVGARWKVRVAERALFHNALEDRDIVATRVDFNGGNGYGIANGRSTRVLDPATFNTMGSVSGGKVATVFTPEVGPFSWPLWVGKAWDVDYSFADLIQGRVWPVAKARVRIDAIEDVTVPAGTFKAFRIASKAGIGSSSSGGRREPGLSGIESNDVHWYAPGVKIVVKSMVERSGTNYLGAGTTTTELLSVPA